MLTAKLEAEHTAIAQQRPREALCRCRAGAQFARKREFLSWREPS